MTGRIGPQRRLSAAVWRWPFLLAALLMLLGAAAPARADYAAGLVAYQRGDFATALAQWKPLAEQGDAKAQLALGVLYDSGRGIPQNPEEAGRWYGLSADRGNVTALYNLGRLFMEGRGVPLDLDRARRLWSLAADNGSAPAAHNIGVMHYAGMGGPQDLGEAARWFQRAADQGYPESQFMLGEMFRLGIGVPQDVATGMRLLSIAELQGNARAAQTLRMLNATPAPAAAPPRAPSQPAGAGPSAATPAPVQAAVPPASAAPAPPLPPAPAQTAAVPPTAGGIQLWIASFSAEDMAQTQWTGLQSAHRDLLGTVKPRLVPVTRSGRTFYRLLVEGFPSKTEAERVCKTLQSRGALNFCQVVEG